MVTLCRRRQAASLKSDPTLAAASRGISKLDMKMVEGAMNRMLQKVERVLLAEERREEQLRTREVRECMEDMVSASFGCMQATASDNNFILTVFSRLMN